MSLLVFPSMLQTKAPIPSCTLAMLPLWHWAASVLCGFMKVAHQSHDVIHSLLTTISSGLSSTFNSTDPSLQKGFSIKVSLRSRRLFFFPPLGCRTRPECCTSLMNLIAACTSAIRTRRKHFGRTKQPFLSTCQFGMVYSAEMDIGVK